MVAVDATRIQRSQACKWLRQSVSTSPSRRLKEQILEFDRMIMAWHRSSERPNGLVGMLARCVCFDQTVPRQRNSLSIAETASSLGD